MVVNRGLPQMIRDIPRCFPAYYSRWMWVALAILFVFFLILEFAHTLLALSWILIAPGTIAHFAVGHAFAFIAQYFREKMNRTSPADVAKPVAYYTPDMSPASYQPTFMKLSTLVKLALFGAGFALVDVGAQRLASHVGLNWRMLHDVLRAGFALGFALGCYELIRAERRSEGFLKMP